MTNEQILEATDEQILDAIKRFHYLFSMQNVIRHNLERTEEFQSQSVSEHIFNMQILCQYFLPLEDPESELDYQKIIQMILFHDLGEIETGDYVTHEKTDNIRHEELVAHAIVCQKAPFSLREKSQDTLFEYEQQESTESKFVNALDKLEVAMEATSSHGTKRMTDYMKINREQILFYTGRQREATKQFLSIARFNSVVADKLLSKIS